LVFYALEVVLVGSQLERVGLLLFLYLLLNRALVLFLVVTGLQQPPGYLVLKHALLMHEVELCPLLRLPQLSRIVDLDAVDLVDFPVVGSALGLLQPLVDHLDAFLDLLILGQVFGHPAFGS